MKPVAFVKLSNFMHHVMVLAFGASTIYTLRRGGGWGWVIYYLCFGIFSLREIMRYPRHLSNAKQLERWSEEFKRFLLVEGYDNGKS